MKKQGAKKFIFEVWKEWRLTIFFIVFVIIPAKSSLADWNWVPSSSMNPTILEGELIYVNKTAYGLRFPLTECWLAEWSGPERGDIVVCFSPEDEMRLVKRVIAVPGDIIEMRDSRLFLNGRAVDYTRVEPQYWENLTFEQRKSCVLAMEDLDGYSHAVMSVPLISAVRNFGPIEVPEGKYFVMGDNRDMSRDSRFFGFVEKKAIVGQAKAVLVSFDINEKYLPRLKRFFTSLK